MIGWSHHVLYLGKSCNDNGTIHKDGEIWGQCGEYECIDGVIEADNDILNDILKWTLNK